jgi:hypothetical protein
MDKYTVWDKATDAERARALACIAKDYTPGFISVTKDFVVNYTGEANYLKDYIWVGLKGESDAALLVTDSPLTGKIEYDRYLMLTLQKYVEVVSSLVEAVVFSVQTSERGGKSRLTASRVMGTAFSRM